MTVFTLSFLYSYVPWGHLSLLSWDWVTLSFVLSGPLHFSCSQLISPLSVRDFVELVVASSHSHSYRLKRANCCSFPIAASPCPCHGSGECPEQCSWDAVKTWAENYREEAGALNWLRSLGKALGRARSSIALGDDCLVFEARQSLSHAFFCWDPAMWQPLF